MTRHQKIITIAAVFVLLLTQYGCAGKLPNYGSFVQNGMDLVELPIIKGGFDPDNPADLPDFSEAPTEIVYWQPDLDLSNLALIDYTRNTRVEYRVSPGKEESINIRPEETLEQGVYCLAEGDMWTMLQDIDHWCFSVNGGFEPFVQAYQARQTSAIETEQAKQAKAEATASVLSTQEQQTKDLRHSLWMYGPDGDEIREIIKKSQNLIKEAAEKRDPSLLDAAFIPDFSVANVYLADIIRCDDTFSGRSGAMDFYPDRHLLITTSLDSPQFYSETYIGVSLETVADYTHVSCYGYNSGPQFQVEEVEAYGEDSVCFMVVKTDVGWRIKDMMIGSSCPNSSDYRK